MNYPLTHPRLWSSSQLHGPLSLGCPGLDSASTQQRALPLALHFFLLPILHAFKQGYCPHDSHVLLSQTWYGGADEADGHGQHSEKEF